jgi:hypothetical protein
MLGLLYRRRSSRQAAMMTTIQVIAIPSLAATMREPMVRPGRAALDGIQERGQVLGLDLRQVPRQDSGRSTDALDHGTAQSQISFLAQVVCLPVPWRLLRRMSNEDFTLLSASLNTGAGTPREAAFKAERGTVMYG